MQPQPGEVVCDPACGTGGMLSVAEQQLVEIARALAGKRFSRLLAFFAIQPAVIILIVFF